jgi:hypothetical protein
MVGTDTEKVLATSSLGVPASTAESTLNLRSFEYGFMPGGYHIWIDTYGRRCDIRAHRGLYLLRGALAFSQAWCPGSERVENARRV